MFSQRFKGDSLAVKVASTLAIIVGASFTKISEIGMFCTKAASSSAPSMSTCADPGIFARGGGGGGPGPTAKKQL